MSSEQISNGQENPIINAKKKKISGTVETPTQLDFNLENVQRVVLRKSYHTILNQKIAKALQPIRTSSTLFIPLLDEYPTVPIFGFQLPNYLALEITSYLGDVNDLDSLAATSAAFRAVARSRDARDSLLKPWLSSSKRLLWAKDYCPRSLARTFSNIQHASNGDWGAVFMQSSTLGCLHGIYLALEQNVRRKVAV